MAAGRHSPSTEFEASPLRDWLILIAASLGKIAVYSVGALIFWTLVTLPFGMAVTTVASGSMEPQIRTGDVVAALPVPESSLRERQVILFDDPAVEDRLRLHRIMDMSPAGIETQGDANPSPDPMLVSPEAVVGVGFVRIPFLGIPMNWVHSGEWIILGIFLFALGGSFAVSNLDRDLRRRDRSVQLASEGAAAVPDQLPDGYTGRSGIWSQLAVWILGCQPKLPVTRGFLGPSRFSELGGGVLVGLMVVALIAQVLTGATAAAAFWSSTSTTASLSAANSFVKPWSNAIFHWGYGEQAPNLGLALDDAGSTLENGTLAGSVIRTTDGTNPFVTLDGVSGQIYSAQFAGAAPNTFSVETWFRTTTTRGGKLIGYGNSQSGASTVYDRHLYMTDAGKLTFGLNQPGLLNLGILGGPITLSSPQSYNDGQWHLATVSVSSSAGTVLYVDGVAVASNSSMTTGQVASNGYWRVGYDSIASNWTGAPTSKYFAGNLDNTTLYPAALSASEASAHFAYGR